jgi:hypothetical protein
MPASEGGQLMLQELVGHKVVVDLRSTFVCMGTLKAFDDTWFDMRHADLHDLRDTQTSRETYVADSQLTGIKRNRKRVLLARADCVAIALLEDVMHA